MNLPVSTPRELIYPRDLKKQIPQKLLRLANITETNSRNSRDASIQE